ncbi:MAG: M42 family metallopeptidase [bacterium]|nr:M42 family metallopeptidase [bacterium]
MLLKELSNLPGPSGYEKVIRDYLKKTLKPIADEIYSDILGNLICLKRSSKSTKHKILISSHMDEVGFLISDISKDGLVRVRPLGGIDPRVVLSKRIYFPEHKIFGVIGNIPIHLQKDSDLERVPDWESIHVDIGAENEKDAKKYLKVGDYGVFDTQFKEIDGTVMGKAFDDRIGCYIITELLKNRYDFDLYAVFSTQEESGLRGIRTAVDSVKPELGFNLECTTAGDLPREKDISPSTELGKGPAITIMDRTSISSPKLLRYLTETAGKNKIPYQFKRSQTGGTDAGYINTYGSGVCCVTVSVPARYIHSPVSIAKKSDIAYTIKLIDSALKNLTKNKILPGGNNNEKNN